MEQIAPGAGRHRQGNWVPLANQPGANEPDAGGSGGAGTGGGGAGPGNWLGAGWRRDSSCRQERLFQRLLDAGRSLEKEGRESEEREGETGGGRVQRGPHPGPGCLGQPGSAFAPTRNGGAPQRLLRRSGSWCWTTLRRLNRLPPATSGGHGRLPGGTVEPEVSEGQIKKKVTVVGIVAQLLALDPNAAKGVGWSPGPPGTPRPGRTGTPDREARVTPGGRGARGGWRTLPLRNSSSVPSLEDETGVHRCPLCPGAGVLRNQDRLVENCCRWWTGRWRPGPGEPPVRYLKLRLLVETETPPSGCS